MSNTNNDFDRRTLNAIACGKRRAYAILEWLVADDIAGPILRNSDRPDDRMVDRSLQRLREKNKISFERGRGWTVVATDPGQTRP